MARSRSFVVLASSGLKVLSFFCAGFGVEALFVCVLVSACGLAGAAGAVGGWDFCYSWISVSCFVVCPDGTVT